MWLILTEPFDPSGAWLSDGLSAYTGQVFRHCTSNDIDRDARCERGGATGYEWFRLHTSSGTIIDSRTVRGVVNLLLSMPPGLSKRMNPADQAASVRNFAAPFMRWLHHCRGPVFNRPNAQGICGDIRMPAEWVSAAESVGLPCLASETHWSRSSWFDRPERVDGLPPIQRVLVIGETIVSATEGMSVPAHIATACSRLAVQTGAPLLGIDLVPLRSDRWCFAASHYRPDLKAGGQPAIDAIAACLGFTRPHRPAPETSRTSSTRGPNTEDLVSAFSGFLRSPST